MSQHHQRIKNHPRWKAARVECLERDGYACVDCGVTEDQLVDARREDQLQADHIEELSVAPELALEVDNLRTLCGPCNRARHAQGAAQALRAHWVSPKYRDALAVAGVGS